MKLLSIKETDFLKNCKVGEKIVKQKKLRRNISSKEEGNQTQNDILKNNGERKKLAQLSNEEQI